MRGVQGRMREANQSGCRGTFPGLILLLLLVAVPLPAEVSVGYLASIFLSRSSCAALRLSLASVCCFSKSAYASSAARSSA